MSVQAKEIAKITKTVFSSLFEWEAKPIRHSPASSDAARVGSSVHVAGRLSGEVAVMCSVPLARRAASTLYGRDGNTPTDREMFDAVREIAGCVGEELTSVRSPSRIKSRSPGSISGGGMSKTIKPSLVFECQGEPCWVLIDAVQIDTEDVRPLQPMVRAGQEGRSRGFERVGVDLNITVHARDHHLTATHARDLSMNGVFVECETTLPRGTDCDVVVHRADEEGVRVAGRVSRNTSNGFAVEFLEVDLVSYGQLRDVVMANLPSVAADLATHAN